MLTYCVLLLLDMKRAFSFGFLLLIVLLSINVFSQENTFVDASLKTLPKISIPREAKKTGLRGAVSVLVEVDQDGRVISATDPLGPDWVCDQVTRADVAAMRSAAIRIAKAAKFSPALQNSKPVSSKFRFYIQFGTDVSSQMSSIGVRSDIGGISVTDTTEKGVVSNALPKTISDTVPVGIPIPKPYYPPAARAVAASGRVIVRVLIEIDGTVFSAEPLTGHPLLQAAARDAACNTKFMPTFLSGQPVRVTGTITYNFVP